METNGNPPWEWARERKWTSTLGGYQLSFIVYTTKARIWNKIFKSDWKGRNNNGGIWVCRRYGLCSDSK